MSQFTDDDTLEGKWLAQSPIASRWESWGSEDNLHGLLQCFKVKSTPLVS